MRSPLCGVARDRPPNLHTVLPLVELVSSTSLLLVHKAVNHILSFLTNQDNKQRDIHSEGGDVSEATDTAVNRLATHRGPVTTVDFILDPQWIHPCRRWAA